MREQRVWTKLSLTSSASHAALGAMGLRLFHGTGFQKHRLGQSPAYMSGQNSSRERASTVWMAWKPLSSTKEPDVSEGGATPRSSAFRWLIPLSLPWPKNNKMKKTPSVKDLDKIWGRPIIDVLKSSAFYEKSDHENIWVTKCLGPGRGLSVSQRIWV